MAFGFFVTERCRLNAKFRTPKASSECIVLIWKKKKSKYLEVFPGRALKHILKQKKEKAQTHAARVWAALIRTAGLEKMK